MVRKRKKTDRWTRAGLTEADFALLRQMRETEKPLFALDSNRIPKREIIVCCSCRNQADLIAWHMTMRRRSQRPHIVTYPCGALGLYDRMVESGLAAARIDELIVVMFHSGGEAIEALSLYVDLPCEHMARQTKRLQFNLTQHLEALARIKATLKGILPQIKVGCFVFVDHGSRRNPKVRQDSRTYFITRSNWSRFVEHKGLKKVRFPRPQRRVSSHKK